MDILEFNEDSDNLIEKYAPSKISDLVNSPKQIAILREWLKNYENNAKMNLQKINDKKTGKKMRKKREKKVIDDDNQNDGDNMAGECDDVHNEDDENGDMEDIKELMKKTKSKDPNDASCVLITGDHGVGKTALARAVLNDLGYKIKCINFAKLSTIKSIDNFIEKIISGTDIYDSLSMKKNNKYAIIIDEVQSVTTPTEKKIVNGIAEINQRLWGCPVIFIGSNKHKKIITNLRKECYHITLYKPDEDDMSALLEKILLSEGMKLENEEVFNNIVNHCHYDFRKLLVAVEELRRIYDTNVITNENLNEFLKYSKERDTENSIYENTNKLFTKYDGINSVLKIFESDKTNMPMMMHQNHFMATNYIKDKKNSIKLSRDIAENIAHGDIIDNHVYSGQIWTLQETYGFYTCVYPSYKLTNNIDTEKLEDDSKNPFYRPRFSPIYPKDFNRTSTRCINYEKNIKPANDFFNKMSLSMQIHDYIIAIQIKKSLLDADRKEECKKLIVDGYNTTYSDVIYMLKIDKINGTKKDIPKSIEKKVKDITVEAEKPATIKKIQK
jgi:chromosomal replication initiation ATPase DnaA